MMRINEKSVSRTALYVLLGLALIVFGAFFASGFILGSSFDDITEGSTMAGAIIVFTALCLVAAVAVTAWSVVVQVVKREKQSATANLIPSRRIAYGVAALTIILLAITYILSPEQEILAANGEYVAQQWPRMADMFIFTSATLIVIALVVMGVGYFKNRKA